MGNIIILEKKIGFLFERGGPVYVIFLLISLFIFLLILFLLPVGFIVEAKAPTYFVLFVLIYLLIIFLLPVGFIVEAKAPTSRVAGTLHFVTLRLAESQWGP